MISELLKKQRQRRKMQRYRKISFLTLNSKKIWLRLQIYFVIYPTKYIPKLPIFKITQNILLYNNILNTSNIFCPFLSPVLIDHLINIQSLNLLYLLYLWWSRLTQHFSARKYFRKRIQERQKGLRLRPRIWRDWKIYSCQEIRSQICLR